MGHDVSPAVFFRASWGMSSVKEKKQSPSALEENADVGNTSIAAAT